MRLANTVASLCTVLALGLTVPASLAAAPATQPSDPVSLWSAGQKDRAVHDFIHADWPAGNVFAPGSIFRMKESEYVAAPPATRRNLDHQIQVQGEEIRALARAVLARAHKADAAGDSASAKQALSAVKACGQDLADRRNGLAAFKLIGTALIQRADADLQKLKH